MITISRTVDLTRLVRVENLSGVAFTAESGGHKFTIRCQKDGVDEPLTGSTVSAKFFRPGDTVDTAVQLLTSEGYAGIDSDGYAWVLLSGNCYINAGAFYLIVYVTDTDSNTYSIYSCAGFIRTGNASTIVDPEATIDVEAISSYITQMQTAIASIPTAVLYTAQTLTDAQKTQALANLGVEIASTSDTETYLGI